ncbi:MAG: transglycosylase domain-containing protein [Gammaproteobacteria bacterium]|nr:transglycosylase domain-containing protein [Gammaproteobacteria bacterium]
MAVNYKSVIVYTAATLAAVFLCVLIATVFFIQAAPKSLNVYQHIQKPQLTDKAGRILTLTFENQWNLYDVAAIHEMPRFLVNALVISEDARFFKHNGVDWRARGHAVWQNIRAGHAVRGASTLTEQVVRLWHPRERTLWSRWLEGIEAKQFEQRFSKIELLEFYFNQVPYAAQRRGVVQAARYYFARDLDTLNEKEMLALVVLVRAPGRYDLHRNSILVEKAIAQLLKRMYAQALIEKTLIDKINQQKLAIEYPKSPEGAEYFARHVYSLPPTSGVQRGRLPTTLDIDIQAVAQRILQQRLNNLHKRNASAAGMLVVDLKDNAILAWAVAHQKQDSAKSAAQWYDTVTVVRQPGSAIKPFVYALALEKGWTPATRINDAPLKEAVGFGQHDYRNYSRQYYGWISLRKALANSLNVPAVRTIQFVGASDLLQWLRRVGIRNLEQTVKVYGDGLALGNGELSLYELVQAYSVLARQGVYSPLRSLQAQPMQHTQMLSAQSASLIANILSDVQARSLEFSDAGVLNYPSQTAVKTGTSTNYRDAWTLAFNDRYLVGAWFGDLDQQAMQELTGSTGPALAVRSMMAELNRFRDTAALKMSAGLVRYSVCIEDGRLADKQCAAEPEWFDKRYLPTNKIQWGELASTYFIRQPNMSLQLAYDPRIPQNKQYFEFVINKPEDILKTEWRINGKLQSSPGGRYLWPVRRGQYSLSATIWLKSTKEVKTLSAVKFSVR